MSSEVDLNFQEVEGGRTLWMLLGYWVLGRILGFCCFLFSDARWVYIHPLVCSWISINMVNTWVILLQSLRGDCKLNKYKSKRSGSKKSLPLDPKSMKNEGFEPPIYRLYPLKMKVVGSHGSLYLPICVLTCSLPLILPPSGWYFVRKVLNLKANCCGKYCASTWRDPLWVEWLLSTMRSVLNRPLFLAWSHSYMTLS